MRDLRVSHRGDIIEARERICCVVILRVIPKLLTASDDCALAFFSRQIAPTDEVLANVIDTRFKDRVNSHPVADRLGNRREAHKTARRVHRCLAAKERRRKRRFEGDNTRRVNRDHVVQPLEEVAEDLAAWRA